MSTQMKPVADNLTVEEVFFAYRDLIDAIPQDGSAMTSHRDRYNTIRDTYYQNNPRSNIGSSVKQLFSPVIDPLEMPVDPLQGDFPRSFYCKLSPGMCEKIISLSHYLAINGLSKVEVSSCEPVWSWVSWPENNDKVSVDCLDHCINEVLRNGNQVKSSILVVTSTHFYWQSSDCDYRRDGLHTQIFPVDVLYSEKELLIISNNAAIAMASG